MTISLELTGRAVEQVRALRVRQDAGDFGLRVGVDPGGCAGFTYSLALAPEADSGDIVLPMDGFDVFVHSSVASLLDGVRIDYVESMASSGFTFSNPNATSSCGCGTSFAAPTGALPCHG